ncbi:hypothetical protein FACS189418_2630 [Clostridia bacterium]|nr:hypothetical protein FACS189418_2630 [Clostridia bacterium]
MLQHYFWGNREVLDEKDQLLWLSYYLVEEREEEYIRPLYGICVTKQIQGSSTEEQQSVILSDSRCFVQTSLNRIMNGCVTPMCLVEALDDLVGELEHLPKEIRTRIHPIQYRRPMMKNR